MVKYDIDENKKNRPIRIFGLSIKELTNSGLVLYARDNNGYYLKYNMRNNVIRNEMKLPFQLIRKLRGALLGRKMDEVAGDIDFSERIARRNETLILNREPINENVYLQAQEYGIKPTIKTAYTDSLWAGYPILEPTKLMKDYVSSLDKKSQQ